MDYVVIFDVATKSRPWLWCAILAIMLVICAVNVTRGWKDWSAPSPLFTRGSLWQDALGVLLFTVFLVGASVSYERERRAMIADLGQGRVSILEGVASVDFEKQCLTVRDARFCPRTRNVTPAFDADFVRSGPVQTGSWLRVSYQGNKILRLELGTRRP